MELLRLDFELSSNGEAIGLYDEVGGELVTLDEAVYRAIDDFESYARIPNGSGPFTKTEILSPGAENPVISSVSDEKFIASIYPNPAGERIWVNVQRGVPSARVIDMMGRTVKQFDRVSTRESLDVMELTTGIYFILIREGPDPQVLRFVKK